MGNVTLVANNWSAGELGPRAEGLVHHPAYATGCRVMENFLPMRSGHFRTMPGSYHAGFSRANTKARLLRWKALEGIYIVELTDLVVRIWERSTHSLVLDGGVPLELASPYTEAQLWQLQYKSIQGKLWLVHAAHAPRYLQLSAGVFSLQTPTFTGDRQFNSAGNYPSIVDYVAGRLQLGATDNEPDWLFLSRSPVAATGQDRLTDFTLGANPDDAIFLKESAERFFWTASHRGFAAGARRSVWASDGSIPTPDTADLNVVGHNGVAPIQPAILGTSLLWIGAPTPSLHMMVFSEEGGGYLDMDLTKFSDHILKPSVAEITPMLCPEPILFLVRSDGVLVSCTVDTSSGSLSYGWARHPRAGLTESAVVAETEAEDELWMSVRRGATRSIEYLTIPEDDDFSEVHYVDDALRLTFGTPQSTISGLDHLEGQQVDAVADGSSMPRKTVTGGQVVYEREVSKIHIGLPYRSRMRGQRPEAPVNTTWQGKKKRVEQATLRMYRSLGGKIGQADEPSSLKPIIPGITFGSQVYGQPPQPFTGDKEVAIGGTVTDDGALWIIREDPFPLTVLASFTRIAVMEV